MKNLKTITLLAILFLIASCANISKFPVSSVIPAADIQVQRQHDKNGNSKITIKAKNMAGVERLTPPRTAYVAWIVSEKDGVRNIGQLKNKNAGMAELETLVPFNFTEVFITAEDVVDASYPNGVEISRIRF